MAITERKFISVEQKARIMFVQLWKWPGMFHFYQWSNLRFPEPNEGCWLAHGPSHNVLLARLCVIVLSSTPLTVSFTANGITQAICLPIWHCCLAPLTVTLPVYDAGSLPGEPDQMSHGSKVTTTPTGASASPSNSAFLGRRGYSDFTAPLLFLFHLYIHLEPLGVVCLFHFPPFNSMFLCNKGTAFHEAQIKNVRWGIEGGPNEPQPSVSSHTNSSLRNLHALPGHLLWFTLRG